MTFSEPIDASSFTYQAIAFSKAGGANLIGPGITIEQLSPTEFEVSNFENLVAPIDGDYTFTVNAAGVKDLAGNSGTGSSSVAWDLITVGPAAPANLAITPDTGISNADGITNVSNVTLTGSLSEPGLAVEVSDNGTALGYATVTGTTFTEGLPLQTGTNNLSVYAVDAAANVSPTTEFTAFYDGTPPVISQVQAPPTNPSQAVNSLAVTFSKAIVPSTFTASAISLTENGRAVALSGLTISANATNTVFTVSGLDSFDNSWGAYVLAVNATAVQDVAGNAGTGATSVTWAMVSPDTTPPTSHVSPLPATSETTQFLVQWSGQDNPGGSGLKYFDVCVQDNGGPFTLWQSQTTATSAVFTGTVGHTYGFYSIATDNADNVEPAKTVAEAFTTVNPTYTSVGTTINANEGTPLSATVLGTFTDSDPNGPTSGFQVMINWGDKSLTDASAAR